MVDLLSCPFCGGERAIQIPANRNSAERLYPIVRCMGCYTDVPGKNNDFSLDCTSAIAAWTRRAPSQDAEIKALREALTEAAGTLEGLSYIHDGNPSDARADMAPVDYARHMLFEARQMAKAAHSEAAAALAGSAS